MPAALNSYTGYDCRSTDEGESEEGCVESGNYDSIEAKLTDVPFETRPGTYKPLQDQLHNANTGFETWNVKIEEATASDDEAIDALNAQKMNSQPPACFTM